MARHLPSTLGATSELFGDSLSKYIADNPDGLLGEVCVGGCGGRGMHLRLPLLLLASLVLYGSRQIEAAHTSQSSRCSLM